jgi:hypothetical protein
LLELDVSKGASLDGIPPLILKNCASAFARPLSLFLTDLYRHVFFPIGGDFPTQKNWSVVLTLITAQKQCLGKFHFNKAYLSVKTTLLLSYRVLEMTLLSVKTNTHSKNRKDTQTFISNTQ